MKRLAVLVLGLCIGLAGVLAQPVSYPLSNGKALKITNLLQPRFHAMFNSENLATQLSQISERFALDTDFEMALNPSDTRIFLVMQSIRVAPDNDHFRPQESKSEITLSLRAHASIVQAMVLWFMSFTTNAAAPQELRTLLLSIARNSTRFIVATDVGDAAISITGSYDTTRSQINFDPSVQFRDISKGLAAGVFTTINMPKLPQLMNLLSGAGIMTLELPENPANPGILRDSWYLLQAYGMR
ncbi:hypothetical protein MASR2M48_11760 [Spirochaetota bacterium]